MKKYILIVVALSIVPSVAFASWWNPFTWNIFSSHQPNPQVQVISTTKPLDHTLTDNSTSTATTTISIATTTEVIVVATSTPPVNVPVKKVVKKVTSPVRITTPPVQVQTSVVSNSSDTRPAICPPGYTCKSSNQIAIDPTPIQASTTSSIKSWTDLEQEWFAKATQNDWTQLTITNDSGEKHYYRLEVGTWVRKDTLAESQEPYHSPNSSLCNGTYWNQCPSGQNFICPGNGGKAYCQSPQTTQTPITIPTNIPQTQTSQIVSSPPVSQGPTPEQQAACQQAYDLGVASLKLGYQSQSAQIEAKYQQDLANQQNSNSWSYGGGERAIEQGFADTRDRSISSLTATYGLSVSNEQMALQKCLNP